MRWSEALIPTLREAPKEAEIASHKLMVRAGMMRRLAAGVYNLLPLGWRVVMKVMRIIREEHDRVGCQELHMPVLHPAELWQESGRWTVYGKELMRLKDRHEREYALGPTHEEVITHIVKTNVKSYRELPLTLYQIQVKFRDEIRPRFGVMRAREFLMKDAYSFHATEQCLDRQYRVMYDVYSRIFQRCGLRFSVVEAESGAIGGDVTHEFMVLAESGESLVLTCPRCGYSATAESARGTLSTAPGAAALSQTEALPLEKVHTPDKKTVEEICGLLGVRPYQLIKTIIYRVDDAVGGYIAVLIRGDREVNEAKVSRLVGGAAIVLASPGEILALTGGEVGFSGPVGLQGVRVIADNSIKNLRNAVTGANETDYHLVNVNPGRDFEPSEYADVALLQAGDLCPNCSEPMEAYRGIEVGQIFKLGTKYSRAMGATFHDEQGKERHYIMGCYGIGVTRTVAAAIEQNHDDMGIIWPLSIAPYQLLITTVNTQDERAMSVSEALYRELAARGVEVLWDERDGMRPGEKFMDGDLIGIPLRATVGPRGLKRGLVELTWRSTKETQGFAVEEAAARIAGIVQDGLKGCG